MPTPEEDLLQEFTESLADPAMLEEKPSQADDSDLDSLTPEEFNRFVQSLFLGFVERTEDVWGKKVTVRSLHVEHEIAIAAVLKPYENSLSAQKIYRAAVVAQALVSIDDVPFYQSTHQETPMEEFRGRFENIKKYFPGFIDQVYVTVLLLEQQQRKVIEKLEKDKG